MQNKPETTDQYTTAFNEIVQKHNQGVPYYFVSTIIFNDNYVTKINQKS